MSGFIDVKTGHANRLKLSDTAGIDNLAAAILHEAPEDCIEALNHQDTRVAAKLLLALPFALAAQILNEPELRREAAIVSALPIASSVPLLEALSPDRMVAIVREMRVSVRNDVMAAMTENTRTLLDKLLPYPADCAGGIMTTQFVSVPPSWTVRQVLAHVQDVEHTRETIYAIFVLDDAGALVRVVPLRRLLFADPDLPVVSIASDRRSVAVDATAPIDDAVRLISKYDLLAVAVLDKQKHVIGIVTVDDAMDSLMAKQDAQVLQFGGLKPTDNTYLHTGPFAMIRQRAGWLCVLFIAEMLTASAMQVFEDKLEKAIVLALFIPLIMSSGGNSGSQATSLIIRALALDEVKLRDWWRVAIRELPTGITLGAILGLIGILRITIWQTLGLFNYGPHWQLVALTIAAALIGIVTAGSLVGSLLPFALKRLGFDPAVSSAPFVATLVDVTGIVIYFSIASLILSGTLL